MPIKIRPDRHIFEPIDVERALIELDQIDCSESLRSYVKLSWPILERRRPFVPGWHIDAICDHLEAVTKGHILRLLITVPPGCMKSMLTNVFWPSWEWGPQNRPDRRYISFSYSQDLTIRDNRRTRALIQSKWFQLRWGDRFKLTGDQNSKIRFDTDQTGYKIATSVGGMGTGERGDRVIVDDAHNVKETESDKTRIDTVFWFNEVLPTRTSDPISSAFVVIGQRTHDEDVPGEILERDLGYVHLNLPMEFEEEFRCKTYINGTEFFQDPRTEENELLWPERMPREVVERDKKVLKDYGTAAQFQQRPSPRGGGLFKKINWQFYKNPNGATYRPKDCTTNRAVDLPDLMDITILSVDCAFKDLDTGSRVGMVMISAWRTLRYVLGDWTDHMDFPKTCQMIKKLTTEHPEIDGVIVEDKANGPAVVSSMKEEIQGIILVNPEGGKPSRAAATQLVHEAGQLYVPEGEPWVEAYIGEHARFGASKKDDRVDATSQAIIWLRDTGFARIEALGRM